MSRAALPIFDLPGSPADAGYAHGRALAGLLRDDFRERYLRLLAPITRTERSDLSGQAARWLEGLPSQFQVEIDAMAAGAGVATMHAAEFLYADIARPTLEPGGTPVAEREIVGAAPGAQPDGPMCSAVSVANGAGAWIGRNCDWLFATLTRGVAGVVHRTPGRIPVLGVGIRGDIDVDTGINAERLWLHLHTFPALDDPPRDRTSISWLFWARQALETCATLDDLERYIEGTGRDRGVIVVASDGKSGETAVFECGRASHTRVDQTSAWLVATNHSLAKEIDGRREKATRRGSTVARYCALRRRLGAGVPREMPDEMMRLLGAPDVEMRDATHLRTIYSAVVHPSGRELWFAAGDATGRPAASARAWARVPIPF